VSALEAAADARIAFPSEQAHVIMGAPGMRRTDSDYYALYLGNHVLGGSGFQSRITREIRSDRGLAYSAYSYFLPMASEGPFLMGLQTRVDQAEEAVDIVRETLAEFIENGPSAKELAASKANITGGFPLRTASNANIAEYLALIGFYDMPLDYLDTFIARIDAVTAQDIREAFQRRLDADRLVTVVVGGESS
jgi:zinc protease